MSDNILIFQDHTSNLAINLSQTQSGAVMAEISPLVNGQSPAKWMLPSHKECEVLFESLQQHFGRRNIKKLKHVNNTIIWQITPAAGADTISHHQNVKEFFSSFIATHNPPPQEQEIAPPIHLQKLLMTPDKLDVIYEKIDGIIHDNTASPYEKATRLKELFTEQQRSFSLRFRNNTLPGIN